MLVLVAFSEKQLTFLSLRQELPFITRMNVLAGGAVGQ